MAIVSHPMVGLSILTDVLLQHGKCYRLSEAAKAKKKHQFDHELSEKQRKKLDNFYSAEYMSDIEKNNIFLSMKMGIASSISKSDPIVLVKANELLNDDAGLHFVLVWVDIFKKSYIDKSCGSSPSEAVPNAWKSELLWKTMAKKYQLN